MPKSGKINTLLEIFIPGLHGAVSHMVNPIHQFRPFLPLPVFDLLGLGTARLGFARLGSNQHVSEFIERTNQAGH
jgi:hypothetical protein